MSKGLMPSSDSAGVGRGQVAAFRLACRLLLADAGGYPLPPVARAQVEAFLAQPAVSVPLGEACWALVLAWARARQQASVAVLEAQYMVWQRTVEQVGVPHGLE